MESNGGAVVKALVFHQCGPRTNPRVDTNVESVVGSLPCSKRFLSLGFPVFPSAQIPTFLHSSLIRNLVEKEPRGCATSKSSFILLIHSFRYFFIYLILFTYVHLLFFHFLAVIVLVFELTNVKSLYNTK